MQKEGLITMPQSSGQGCSQDAGIVAVHLEDGDIKGATLSEPLETKQSCSYAGSKRLHLVLLGILTACICLALETISYTLAHCMQATQELG